MTIARGTCAAVFRRGGEQRFVSSAVALVETDADDGGGDAGEYGGEENPVGDV